LSFDPDLEPNETIDNKRLCDIFKCSTQGGMRRSLSTNSLIIVSNHVRSIYEDRWVDDVLHYTGMGLKGDQHLDYAQNKTLDQSRVTDTDCFLFEVLTKGEYIYRGQAELAGEPYQEKQPDTEGKLRIVWMFPLKLAGDVPPPPLPKSLLRKKQELKERSAQGLSDDELAEKASHARRGSSSRAVTAHVHERNEYVSELAKRRANGICQLCEKPAPFTKSNGDPYLESHHVEWLAEGGDDVIENTVALCPNCHRKMYVLSLARDIRKLKATAQQVP